MLVKQVTLATQNGFIGAEEVKALTRTIADISSKSELKDVYDELRKSIAPETTTQKARSALLQALYAKDAQLGGGTFPLMVTMAVGEDQFGMGNVNFPGRDELVRISTDGVVTAKEAKELVALFGKATSAFEFERLFQGVSTLVAKNLIAVSDRSAVAAAAQGAAARVGSQTTGMMTRALGEDAFGFNPAAIGNQKIEKLLEKATANGALSAAEVKVLTREVKTLDEAGLKAAYAALRKAVNETALSKESRSALIGALFARQHDLKVSVLPAVMTMAVGEDQFGIAHLQSPSDKALLSASTDGALSKAEGTRLKALVKAAATLDDLRDMKDALSAFLAGNMCSPGERRQLAKALQDRAQALGGGFAVTRAVGEDLFGM